MRKPQLYVVAPFALLVATLMVSCGTRDGDEPTTQPPLSARTLPDYVVTGITESGKTRTLVKGSEIRLAFKDGQLRITAGCNSMSGAYRLEGSRLAVESLATTEMGCDQPLMAQDTWVAGLFAEPVQFSEGNDAAIISGDVVLSLTDRKVASPDKPLEGTRWVLDGIIDGDTASSVPEGTYARVEVRDGQVRVLDACHKLDATGTVSGHEITWGPGRMTLDGCTDHAGSLKLEVGATSTYSITEHTLTITNGDHGLTFRAH